MLVLNIIVFCLYLQYYIVTHVTSLVDGDQESIGVTHLAVERAKNKEGNNDNVENLKNVPVINNSSEVPIQSNEDMNKNVPRIVHGKPESAVDNSTSVGIPQWWSNINSGALERTGLVALGIMSVLLFFFVIRAIRIRQKRSKSRKYGIITSTASDTEMEPLDREDDDEEETTLFDAQHHKFRTK